MAPRRSDEEKMRIIGRNIERLLNLNRMNQADLAKLLGISESAVGKWILARNAPAMGNVQRMADYFGVSITDILEEPTAPEPPRSRSRQVAFDRIEHATEEQIQQLNDLLDVIWRETEQ